MKRSICLAGVVVVVLLFVGARVCGAAERYEANWESLDQRATPQWWVDAKFGIFMHWGVYSVPALSVDDVPCQYAYVFRITQVK
jgi:hypothetical protein